MGAAGQLVRLRASRAEPGQGHVRAVPVAPLDAGEVLADVLAGGHERDEPVRLAAAKTGRGRAVGALLLHPDPQGAPGEDAGAAQLQPQRGDPGQRPGELAAQLGHRPLGHLAVEGQGDVPLLHRHPAQRVRAGALVVAEERGGGEVQVALDIVRQGERDEEPHRLIVAPRRSGDPGLGRVGHVGEASQGRGEGGDEVAGLIRAQPHGGDALVRAPHAEHDHPGVVVGAHAHPAAAAPWIRDPPGVRRERDDAHGRMILPGSAAVNAG